MGTWVLLAEGANVPRGLSDWVPARLTVDPLPPAR
jgi:hypothetical protein